MRLVVHPCKQPLTGRLQPPGDKSISHRLAILGGLAQGPSVITGYLDSADTLATLAAMEKLGAQVERLDQEIRMTGGFAPPERATLDLGNSGTGVRLLAGALAGRSELFGSELTLIGDHSLSARPMGRIIEPLTSMGADLEAPGGHLPLRVRPRGLHAIRYRPRVASAQVKSAVLLAGLVADGETVLIEPGPSRDHTERLLPAFGVTIARQGEEIRLVGGQALRGGRFHVPGDLSSAAFLIAAALLVPDSDVTVDNVGLNPSRDGVLKILAAMQGRVHQDTDATVGEEPVGSLRAQSSELVGIAVPPDWVPLAIDEFPIIMALAAAAKGTTVISGAEELRVKESDRLAVMCRQLARLGVDIEETPDGATIRGGTVTGGEVDSCGDHRIAMSLAVLGLVAREPVAIRNAEWIRTSYPGFVDDLAALGAELEWQED
ncbi:MAG: 3-phosphoshikimate 1-carboxyvinyltransferase [Wenzhouxiangella sp.]|jgi:3-phosphoshikimate 1-carboxyvinyltransferase|nr:3-phosphoshikimate 1-carboxyvinyltransferase [Wenzhouxiangella sp.]